MILEARSVLFQRAEKQILQDVSVQFDRPELIGLIGPNGAGKSTLMKLLAGVLPCDGLITLGGRALQTIPAPLLAQHIAYLPQERTVHWALNCQEIVALGRTPYHPGLFRGPVREDDQAIETAMAYMDVHAFKDRVFKTLSGGEQARVLIARVLAQETAFILADEPTNGLDPAHQIGLMQLFRRFVTDQQKIILVSLHDLALASRWCDRIILLNKGSIAADGDVADVMTKTQIGSVYGVSTAQLMIGERPLITPVDLLKQ